MKRTRKFLSLLLTLCMTLSLVTGLTASAEDAAFALMSYDADSDFITLDFNQAVDTESAVISLEKEGKAVEFTFESANYISTNKNDYVQNGGLGYKGNELPPSATYHSYLVKPTDGIDFDVEYKLTLSTINNSDKDKTETISGWTKYFIVKDLGGEMFAFRASANTAVTYDGLSANVTAAKRKYTTNAAMFGTGVGADADNLLTDTSVKELTEKDYTIKATYTKSGLFKEDLSFGIINTRGTATDKGLKGTFIRLQSQSTSSANVYLYEDNSTSDFGTKISVEDNARPTGLSYTNGVELKFSTKNKLAHAYVNGKKIADKVLENDFIGFATAQVDPIQFTSTSGSTTGNGTVTFSSFLATRSTWTDETTIIPTPLLVSYDADTDFITLNFDKKVNITKDNIILSKDGVAVPVTVASANHNNLKATNSTVNTYLVKPANGKIEVNKEYKLTLTNISDTEGTETLTSWAKAFTVAELAKGLKLPEDANDKKMSYKANSSSYTVSNVNEDELKVQYNGTATDAVYAYRAVGNDDGTTFAEKDYTVKAVFKDVANTPYANFGVAIASSKGYTFDHGQFRGTGMRMQVQPLKASDLTQGIGKYANMYIYTRTADANATKNQGAADIYGNDTVKGVEMKLAIKEGQVIGFINGKKIIDMTCYDAAGMAKMYFAPKSSENAVVTIADFIATRATWKNATPDTKIELVDWDADSDFVTLDFNEEINISEENVTLTNGGVTVPVTVALANHKDMESARSERYTYIVKPVSGGIALDIPYTINVAGITAKNDENSKFEGFTKTFKVEKIAEGLQLADGTMQYESRSVFNVSNVNTDEIKADYTSVSASRVQLYRAVGNDKIKASYVGTDSPYEEKDYTVKTTFKNISGTSHADMVLAISYSYDAAYGSDHNYFRGVSLRSVVNPKDSTNTAIGTKANMTFHNINGYDKETEKKSEIKKAQSAANISGMDVVNGVELKISTKNKFARAYINGGKVADMQLLQDYAGFAQIHFSPRNTKEDNLATVTIADFLATRAVEVTETLPEFTVSDLTVTADGEAVESITGKTKINVSAELTNNTIAEKDVYIACALYTNDGEMKNCVVSEVKKAVAGKNPVNFMDVDVNGADKVKVFIWDGLDALDPYFPALTFPAE